jgi:transcriptional regulator with XRE-family HTH domain/antitoxin (DNA-binding transcriptional repressor) of toxin-antitoxin stability system
MPAEYRRALGALLGAERRRRRLTKPEMARRMIPHVAEQCPSLDTLISYLKRWEAGKSGISERYRFACAKALGMDQAGLFGLDRVPEPSSLGALAPPPGSLDETGTGDWDDMERRRLLLAALGVGAGALASSGPLNTLIDLALTSEPRGLGEWQLAVADHLHAIRTRPPAQARDDLLVDLLSLRRQMTIPGADVTELQRVLAALSTLHGGVLTRLGDHGAALRWWRTARHAADAVGDPDLRLLVRGEEAGFGLYGQRDPATVLRLLDDADRIAGGSRSVWRADLTRTRAKALSLLGRHDQAKTAVRALVAAAPDDAPAGPIPTLWVADQIYFAESWVYAAAGDESAADEARGRVLAYRGDYQYAANVSLHDALCTVVKGGIAEGARHASGVLDSMPAGFRSHMITETGKTVLRAVPREQQERPAVREFYEVLTATAPRSRTLAPGA